MEAPDCGVIAFEFTVSTKIKVLEGQLSLAFRPQADESSYAFYAVDLIANEIRLSKITAKNGDERIPQLS